ncbi:MAG: hypothetical protein J6Y85_05780 [Alphaproteobacteria bacterium]|nr:hypothetical protein [Alphaproteobacteria bacterium]
MQDFIFKTQKKCYALVKDWLNEVGQNGLTDESYLMIAFETPGATIPDFVRAKYPQEMTIVLQYQFDNLSATDTSFSVDLSFGGVATTVVVPFENIKAIIDPTTNFGFYFHPHTDTKQEAEIISLDALRNKK